MKGTRLAIRAINMIMNLENAFSATAAFTLLRFGVNHPVLLRGGLR